MTLWDVKELGDYWAEHPPVHILVAAFVGYKGEGSRMPAEYADPNYWQSPKLSPGDVAQLAQSMEIPAGNLDGYPVPIFDFDELMRQRPN
jgi:hypothetical protein